MKHRLLRGRLFAIVALASFVLSFVSPLDAMGDLKHGDDAACGQSLWFGGHADQRIEPGTTAPPAQHCPYCHFLRAVSGASPAAIVTFVRPTHVAPAASVFSRRIGTTVIDERPSRAPPTTTLS